MYRGNSASLCFCACLSAYMQCTQCTEYVSLSVSLVCPSLCRSLCVCACACMCVRMRERKKEREREPDCQTVCLSPLILAVCWRGNIQIFLLDRTAAQPETASFPAWPLCGLLCVCVCVLMKSQAAAITLPHIQNVVQSDSLQKRKNRQLFITGTEVSDGLMVKIKKTSRTRPSCSC